HARARALVLVAPILHPPTATLSPYTTLFRSAAHAPTNLIHLHGRDHVAIYARIQRGNRPVNTHLRQCLNEGRNRRGHAPLPEARDRKSTRLNSSHVSTSYAVFCLQKNTVTPE